MKTEQNLEQADQDSVQDQGELKTLSRDEFTRIMSWTSPHSFKHNVIALHQMLDIPISTELVTDIEGDPEDLIPCLDGVLTSLKDVKALSDPRLKIALVSRDLANTAITLRSIAAVLGIPLEDIQDAIIASCLNGVDPQPTINTMLFGLSADGSSGKSQMPKKSDIKARHPYERIDAIEGGEDNGCNEDNENGESNTITGGQ